ncbi:MAG: NAD(P)/FAD-dependent oxidoreductase, partial [Lachnospiraceae bacterium]|nr:NAD(P)/FAD-dependent oxidoreductase [Lachnospiraceae bacterium]
MSDLKKKIAIIGGGASGMTAAIAASRLNALVTVFEENSVQGKKICATGNGKCNFTNDALDVTRYRGGNADFMRSALSRFGVAETLKFFEEIGITPKKKGEYVYPNSEEARSVQKALILTMEELGVETVFEKVSDIKQKGNGFIVNDRVFDKVIIACGSPAGLKKDSGFNGYDLVKSLGHHVTPVFPALVQLRFNDRHSKTLSGVRLEGLIKLFADGKNVASDYG